MTFISNNEFNTVLGGPGSRLDDYSSISFLNSFIRSKIRKDKIKRLFSVDGK